MQSPKVSKSGEIASGYTPTIYLMTRSRSLSPSSHHGFHREVVYQLSFTKANLVSVIAFHFILSKSLLLSIHTVVILIQSKYIPQRSPSPLFYCINTTYPGLSTKQPDPSPFGAPYLSHGFTQRLAHLSSSHHIF